MAPKYIVTEIQTALDGNVATIVNAYDALNLAEARFHTILAAAAVSNLAKHAAIMFSEEGLPLRYECYNHLAAAEAEAE